MDSNQSWYKYINKNTKKELIEKLVSKGIEFNKVKNLIDKLTIEEIEDLNLLNK